LCSCLPAAKTQLSSFPVGGWPSLISVSNVSTWNHKQSVKIHPARYWSKNDCLCTYLAA
jgi:hypothetical protein